MAKGGANMASFFKAFAINGETDPAQIGANIYQAALVVYFATRANEKNTLAAMQAVTGSFDKGGKAVEKAVKDLEKAATDRDKEIRDFLKDLVKKG